MERLASVDHSRHCHRRDRAQSPDQKLRCQDGRNYYDPKPFLLAVMIGLPVVSLLLWVYLEVS